MSTIQTSRDSKLDDELEESMHNCAVAWVAYASGWWREGNDNKRNRVIASYRAANDLPASDTRYWSMKDLLDLPREFVTGYAAPIAVELQLQDEADPSNARIDEVYGLVDDAFKIIDDWPEFIRACRAYMGETVRH